MPGSGRPSFVDMIDMAIHAQGHGDRVSRQKIHSYIEEHWQVDTSITANRNRVKSALEKRIKEGLIEQDKQSFTFTKAGTKAYRDAYETSEEEEERPAPKKATSKKVTESTKKTTKKNSK
ncbi:hypothetical protein JCM10908_006754 [Rhodotorula pacifica]|uniref:uncharacterized protein n=1 Tax=Rhodotorula pacifica TaxID=1495444 RepID=UPI00317F9CF7